MSAGVVVILLHPLLSRQSGGAANADGSTAVYRDQLAEIDAEAARGLIGAEEAEAARREIARRLLASAPAGEAAPRAAAVAADAPSVSRLPLRVAALTGALVPILALIVYLQTGAPGLPAQPVAARRETPPVNAEMAKLIGAVEKRLQDNPADGRGWDVIAPVYLRLARYGDAAHAYGRANALLGDSAKRLAGLAEALMLAENGRVTDAARTALTKLLQLEPGHVQARFWLAFGLEQDGRLAEALADYEKLLSDAPSDATWRPMVTERVAAVRGALNGGQPAETNDGGRDARAPDTAASGPGPGAADVAAAERMSPAERQAMIDGMVTGLAARLEKDGRDLAGWQRLIRALTVLGRKDEALAALERARKSLAEEPQALAALADLAKSLGLGT
jgi:cytochrome c-type biogenesis protein CcmH